MAKRRSKLIKIFYHFQSAELKDQINSMDQQIKKIRCANFRATLLRESEDLQSLLANEGARRFNGNCLFETKYSDTPQLSKERYREFLESCQRHSANIDPSSREIPPTFVKYVKMATMKAHNNRVPGPVRTVSELFKISPNVSSQLIIEIWKAVSLVKQSPKLLNLAIMVPIFKKDDGTITKKLQADRLNVTSFQLRFTFWSPRNTSSIKGGLSFDQNREPNLRQIKQRL